MARRHFFTLVALLLVGISLLPLLTMFARSLVIEGQFSLEAYSNLLRSCRQWTLLGNSSLLSTLVTILAVGLGLPLGILLGKTDLPGRRFFSTIFILPLLVPPYILAVSWSDFLGNQGLLAQVLGTGAAETATRFLFGLPGCTIILFSIFLPIPMLLTMVLLRTINPKLEEAGKLVTGWTGVLKGITIPLIRPGVVLAGILVFLLSFGEFGVPNFLRFGVFPVESFTQFSAFYNFKTATAAASPLVLVALVLLLIETIFLREKTYQIQPAVKFSEVSRIPLGPYRWSLFFLVIILATILVFTPLLALVLTSWSPGSFSAAWTVAGPSLLRSIGYALIGATLLTSLGFLTGYLVQRKVVPFWRSVDSLTLFLFAVPSTVVGIGLISLWNTPLTNFVYGTPVIIIFGYLAKYLALTSRITISQLTQIPISMEEAALVSGGGWFRSLLLIIAPLARPGLIAGWIVGYVFSLRDTGITMLVYPPGQETLPVRIMTLMANGSPSLIAALCLIMIAITLVPIGLLVIFYPLTQKKAVR